MQQSTKEQIHNLDFIEVENFLSFKDTLKMIKRQSQTERKYMQNTYLIKDFYPKYK